MHDVHDVIEDQEILETNYLDTKTIQEKLSLMIVFSGGIGSMNLSVQFDRQFFRIAIEIENKMPDTCCLRNLRPERLEFFKAIQRKASAGVRFLRSFVRRLPSWVVL